MPDDFKPTMLNAEQHRWMAQNILATAGTHGHPTVERAKQMAQNHEIMAKMIDARAAGIGGPPFYFRAPSIVPAAN